MIEPVRFEGILDAWGETGTEGLVWVVLVDGAEGYDAIRIIEEGDRLMVFDGATGLPFFDSEIKPDRKANYETYPNNPSCGQPCVLGYWVHWTQSGMSPEDWAKMFLRGDKPPLRALLLKRG